MTLKAHTPLKARAGIAAIIFVAMATPLPAVADPFFFSTGDPDGKIATASRPESAANEPLSRTACLAHQRNQSSKTVIFPLSRFANSIFIERDSSP